MVLDTSTPPLNKLTIIGVLEVEDTASGSRQARSTHGTVEIDAVYISIQVSFPEILLDLMTTQGCHRSLKSANCLFFEF